VSAITVACAAALVGCGSASAPAAPPIHLSIERPIDRTTTLGSQVLVRGTVAAPGPVTVLVGGRRVPVSGGAFTTEVAVRPGSNVIDVLAGGAGAQPAMSALRVYRELPVAVPDLDGRSPEAASAELQRVGLRPVLHDGGGFFENLLPLSKHVCASVPPAGRSVAPGSAVALQIAKLC
jgi:hypothetical protein